MTHAHRISRRRLRGALAVLKGLRNVAEDAILTGTFEEAGAYTVRQYNRVLEMLRQDSPDLDLRLFDPIDEHIDRDEGIAQVGIACTLLIRYLKNEIGSEPDEDWDEDEPGGDGDEDDDGGDDDEGGDGGDEEEDGWDEDDGEEGDEPDGDEEGDEG